MINRMYLLGVSLSQLQCPIQLWDISSSPRLQCLHDERDIGGSENPPSLPTQLMLTARSLGHIKITTTKTRDMEDILNMAVNREATISIHSRGATMQDTRVATIRHIVSSILGFACISTCGCQKPFPNVMLFSGIF